MAPSLYGGFRLKICSRCRKNKADSEFGKNKYYPNGLDYYCRMCRRTYENSKYKKDPTGKRVGAAKFKKKNKAYIQSKMWEFLKGKACVDCGISDPIVFEFDHINGDKKYNVASMMSIGTYKWETIQKEMDKCEILCANCHRRRTVQTFNWWKGSYGSAG